MLNHDGGGVLADHGKPLMMEVDATEKLYVDFARVSREARERKR